MARNPDATVRVLNLVTEPVPVAIISGSSGGGGSGDASEATLQAILAELNQKLEAGQTVTIDAGSLAALEAITATVANFPADYPDAASLAKLEAIRVIAEAIRVILAGTVAVAGTVALDGASLAALETVNALVTGVVAVSNFPATQPVTGPLTDAELRTTPVPVSGTVSVAEPVTVDGTVTIDAGSLAALETVSVGNFPALQSVDATDLDIRDLTLPQDSVRQTGRVMTPLSVSRTGPLTDDVLIAVTAPDRLRVLRIAHHVDPALAAGNYPVVTLKVGALVVYLDKMEPGLPWSEWCCFEGAAGEDLTLTLPEVATVYFNLRFELF